MPLVKIYMTLNDEEMAVADWVYRHAEPAGRHTNTLPAAQLRYLPLKTSKGVMGVLGVGKPNTADTDLTPAQRRLMESFANQGAQAIERALLEEQNRQMVLLQSAEKLQNALLNSISHDLRTPLVAITGALSALDENHEMDEPTRNALIENARGEAERLNRLVGNLLNMTRIESGAIKLRLEPGDVQDLIGTAIEQLGKRANIITDQSGCADKFPACAHGFHVDGAGARQPTGKCGQIFARGFAIEVVNALVDSKARLQILDRGAGYPVR
jgi:two-component system, OmpR family, sensor histidine kinase KdpD